MINKPDIETFTLRSRWFDVPPIVGGLIASLKGRTVYRIVDVTSVRTAGDPKSQRFRLICELLNPSEVPEGAVILPWPRERLPPPPRPRKALGSRPSADPGPPELAGARLDRIRESRNAGVKAKVARGRRVGQDDRVQHGRDYGPDIRLRTIRGRRNEVLRGPDVEMEEGPDPNHPNKTVRRMRRCDPLTALLKAGTVTPREANAVELLREQLEASERSSSSMAGELIRVAPHQSGGFPFRQIKGRTLVREALSSVSAVNSGPVLWVTAGGSLRGYVAYARIRLSTASDRLSAGLGQLVDHYYGDGEN
jgi:hypothetical protein